MIIVLIRSVILYIIVIFSIRLMGKRQIGELQPSELVITILVSNIATLPIEDADIPLIMGALPILTLVSLDVLMSWLTMKNSRLRRIISGSPQIIIKDGKIDIQCMRNLRFTIDDIMESIRENGIFDINDVQFAVAETNGKISIYEKYSARNVTNSDLNIHGKNKNPPYLIINDGILIKNSLNDIGLSEKWLESVLEKEKLKTEQIFIMTANEDGIYNIIRKEG